MSTNSIAFVSNTITKPFERFMGDFTISHYPLDTIIDTLYSHNFPEELLIVLIDASFFADTTQLELFENALLEFRSNNSSKIIINTVYAEFFDIYTPKKIQKQLTLTKLNAKLASLQESISDLAILDLFTLCTKHGADNLINERNHYLFQTPFTKNGTEIISTELLKLIELFHTPRIKAIAVDADNTLWGGIIGEDGIDGIKIDNNYPGIVYKKFQEYLLELKNNGIILILLSKNDANAVNEVFSKKQMPLSLDDFVAHAVNWNSKAENLNTILKELKLTKTGIIFLDDSNTEIEEMQSRMGIECFKMNPENPLANIKTLQNITALKALHLSEEDIKKTALYNDEKKRNDLNSAMTSKADFIASLHISITITCNDEKHLERITQLTNKTNQFNLTTKRYELAQIKELMQTAYIYDFNVSDKFGDMGLVGVVIVKEDEIDTFLMSCRVLGRGIEECVLGFITRRHPNLEARYCKTEKNSLVKNFYENNGFECYYENENSKHYKFAKFADMNESIRIEYGS